MLAIIYQTHKQKVPDKASPWMLWKTIISMYYVCYTCRCKRNNRIIAFSEYRLVVSGRTGEHCAHTERDSSNIYDQY